MSSAKENERLRANIRLAVEKMPRLQALVIYDTCGTNEHTLDTFSYAAEKGIQLVIPDNTLKLQNMRHYRDRHNRRKAWITVIRDWHLELLALLSLHLKICKC